MTPTYSQSDLYLIVNGMVHQKFSQVSDRQVVSNRAVRFVLGDMDLATMKRQVALSPNMFTNIFDYTAPSDLKGNKIVDLRKQVNRPSTEKWLLVDEADFDRKKNLSNHRIAVRNENFSKLLRIDGIPNSTTKAVNDCNSLTTNGTWTASADASNLTLDQVNYITGGASLNFDMAKGAATGYIENSDMAALDLSDYEDIGSVFVWVYIPDYSDAQADTVTNFILRFGSSSSNYDSITVTTDNAGNTFHDGWNLLRFNLDGSSSTGTPDYSAINYIRLTVTKSTSLEADTDWRVDNFLISKGEIYDVIYYSKYGWTNSSGTYIEESSATTDLLIADTDEVEGIAFKASEFASQELKEKDEVGYFKNEYETWKKRYLKNNPSEALKIRRSYGGFKI